MLRYNWWVFDKHFAKNQEAAKIVTDHPIPQLTAADTYSILAELQTPLAELGAVAEASRQMSVQALANQTLRLFNGLIYAQRLDGQSADSLDWQAVSLTKATADIVADLEPLAELYNVSLSLDSDNSKTGVSLVRPAFDCATHCLLSGFLSRLQNCKRPELNIRITNPAQPSLEVVSRAVSLEPEDFQVAGSQRVRQKLRPERPGLASGLVVAGLIYRRLGSALSFINGDDGRGVRVAFKPIRQMSLVESLS